VRRGEIEMPPAEAMVATHRSDDSDGAGPASDDDSAKDFHLAPLQRTTRPTISRKLRASASASPGRYMQACVGGGVKAPIATDLDMDTTVDYTTPRATPRPGGKTVRYLKSCVSDNMGGGGSPIATDLDMDTSVDYTTPRATPRPGGKTVRYLKSYVSDGVGGGAPIATDLDMDTSVDASTRPVSVPTLLSA
jgi:hypothetical protein